MLRDLLCVPYNAVPSLHRSSVFESVAELWFAGVARSIELNFIEGSQSIQMDSSHKILVKSCRIAMVVLLILSIPWYGSQEFHRTLLFGMPAWVARALICYLLVALINMLAWRLYFADAQDALGAVDAPDRPIDHES